MDCFDTKTEAKIYIREVLARNSQAFLTGDDDVFMRSVLSDTDEWAGIADDVDRLFVDHGPRGQGHKLIAFGKNGEPLDVILSWTSAFQSPASRQKQRVRYAFRNEIMDDIGAFRRSFFDSKEEKTCQICQESLCPADLEIDHEVQFTSIICGWTKEAKVSENDLKVAASGKTVLFSDRQLAESWKAYHTKHAVLRATHGSCNKSRKRASKRPLNESK
jgi:hypothetical protein